MKRYILILALSLVQAAAFAQTFKTTVTAPSEVRMTVFEGFADSSKVVEPVSKSISGGTARYVYDLPCGNYHFVSSGYGYLSLNKNFTVGGKARTIDANPGRLGEKGYQATDRMTYSYTDEVNASCLDTKELSKRFPKVLTTPGFSKGKPVGEHATQREMEEYLAKLDKAGKNMYTYTAGRSTGGMKIPLAVFTTTDLSGLDLEEAGAAVLANGKPTVFLHAEIHGNENSPSEGALAMCAELNGSYGAGMLPKINVIVMPRINCDGALAWTRGTSVSRDMNRDNLLCKNPEVKATHRVYNAFRPEIVLDMHEYGVKGNYSRTEGYLDDAGITVGGNQNNSRELNGLQKEMMRYVENSGKEAGLRFWEYTQEGYSDQSPLHASHYYALRSSANILVETPSSYSEKRSSFARRVFTQFFAAHALMKYAADNAEKLHYACKADQEHIISSREPFILRHGQNEEGYTYERSVFSYVDGHKIKDTTFTVRYYEVPLITRKRPEAYVIPKDVRQIKRILEIADCNGITYEELPSGTKMTLVQYANNPKWYPTERISTVGNRRLKVTEKIEKCALLQPQETVFEKGAYLFKTAQPSGLVLMFLMEPDVIKTDQYAISLRQAGLLSLKNLYRLDASNGIDFSVIKGSEVLKKAERIKKSQCSQRDGFFFWTDTHLQENMMNAPAYMRLAVDISRPQKVVFGGDAIPAFDNDIDKWWEIQKKLNNEVMDFATLYSLRGNHDFTCRFSPSRPEGKTWSQEKTAAAIAASMNGEVCRNEKDPGGCYYYFDVPGGKLRYIVFDTTDSVLSEDIGFGTVPGIGRAQYDWIFRKAVLEAPEGYGLVLLSHVPLNANFRGHKDYADLDKAITALAHHDDCRLGDQEYKFSLRKDLSLLFVLSGHCHHDMQFFTDGVLGIITASDACYKDFVRSPFISDRNTERSHTERCQAVDYVSISEDSRTVTMTRMGVGDDRVYHLDRTIVGKGGKAKLQSSLEGDCSWSSYDGIGNKFIKGLNYSAHWELSNENVSVSPDGTVTGVKGGEAIVVASRNGIQEFFPVIVK